MRDWLASETTVTAELAFEVGEILTDLGVQSSCGVIAVHVAGYTADTIGVLGVLATTDRHAGRAALLAEMLPFFAGEARGGATRTTIPERTITSTVGPIAIRRARVRGVKHESTLIPKFRRRLPSIDKTIHHYGSKALRIVISSRRCADCSAQRRRFRFHDRARER